MPFEDQPTDRPRPHARPGCLLPLLIMLLGPVIIGLVAGVESRRLRDAPWADALVLPENRLDAEGAIPVATRRVPLARAQAHSALLAELMAQPGGEDTARQLGLLETERVYAVAAPAETFAPLLGSGRLPEPGKPEVLAGPLARFDDFTLDDTTFRVVGRFRGTVSGLVFAYLLPDDPAFDAVFSPAADATRGCIVPDGLRRLDQLFPEDQPDEHTPVIMQAEALTPPVFSLGICLGLAVTALGGALLLRTLFARLRTRWMAPLLDEVRARPRLFWATHLLLYGAFFAAMLYGVGRPDINHHVGQFIRHHFTDGDLGYIGRAYGSGNILHAAAATFLNNYVLQTLGLTLLASLPPLAFGFFKTALSFILAGVAMAPIWLNHSAHLTYHAITMVLEFEAYIIASFTALAWPLRLQRAFRDRTLTHAALRGLKTFAAAALATALLLAAAALYEAATLILLRGLG